MGLAQLLGRSGPVPPALPSSSSTFSSSPPPTDTGPGGWFPPATRVLPPPSERSALSVPAFWRGHAYVCGSVGLLPVTAWRDDDELDPQPSIMRQPDPNQTPMAFWAGVTSALTLYGNAICVITSTDRLGYPTALMPVHPLYAAVKFAGNPSDPTIAGWYLAGQFYDPSEVWHVKSHLGRTGWPLGRGLLDGVPDGIAAAQAVQDYGASFFGAGAIPSGVVKVHRPEITQQQADAIKANWIAKLGGSNAGIAVLNEMTDFIPVAVRPVDSQMIEARQMSLTEVALMWGLPPSKLGSNATPTTYKNAENEEIQARNDAVVPWVTLLEQAVSLAWLPRGQSAAWDMDAKLRADTLTRYQAYQFAMGGPGPQSLWLLPDEVRELEHLDPMADAISDMAAEAMAAEAAEGDAVEPSSPTAVTGGPAVPNTTTTAPSSSSSNGSGPTPAPERG
jgi:HK97 family phage portal protein